MASTRSPLRGRNKRSCLSEQQHLRKHYRLRMKYGAAITFSTTFTIKGKNNG